MKKYRLISITGLVFLFSLFAGVGLSEYFDLQCWNLLVKGGVTYVSNSSTSEIHYDNIELTNAEIKALRGTKKELVAAPGATKFIELVSLVLILDYGSNVLTESTDNLVCQYATSGQDATAAIEMTGFIDQSADTVAIVSAASVAAVAASNVVNNALELFNTGDGEIAGNAGLDTTLTVKIAYRIHSAGL